MEMEQTENKKHRSQSEGGPSPKRQKLNSTEDQVRGFLFFFFSSSF